MSGPLTGAEREDIVNIASELVRSHQAVGNLHGDLARLNIDLWRFVTNPDGETFGKTNEDTVRDGITLLELKADFDQADKDLLLAHKELFEMVKRPELYREQRDIYGSPKEFASQLILTAQLSALSNDETQGIGH